jgi:hypothetical protein
MDAKLLNSILRDEDDPRVLDCSYNVVSVSFPEIKWPRNLKVVEIGAWSGIRLRDGVTEDIPIYKVSLLFDSDNRGWFGSFFKFNAAVFDDSRKLLYYKYPRGLVEARWFDNTVLKNCVIPDDWASCKRFGLSVDLFWVRYVPRLEVFDGTQI